MVTFRCLRNFIRPARVNSNRLQRCSKQAGLPFTLQTFDLKDRRSIEDFNNLNGKGCVRTLNSTMGSC